MTMRSVLGVAYYATAAATAATADPLSEYEHWYDAAAEDDDV